MTPRAADAWKISGTAAGIKGKTRRGAVDTLQSHWRRGAGLKRKVMFGTPAALPPVPVVLVAAEERPMKCHNKS